METAIEQPVSLRLLTVHKPLARRSEESGISQADLIRFFVGEGLARYKTPRSTIAAVIRAKALAAAKR
jgi:hypothetical protein